MATLQKKKTNGIYYWYIVESVRVNGKPRPKVIAYLGRPKDIVKKLQGAKPVSSKSYEYGTIAVVEHFIKRIGIIDIVNQVVFKNKPIVERANLNLGQTVALMIQERTLYPRSKRAFHKWAKRTFLPFIYKFAPKKIDSQHFWDMMDLISDEQIPVIEQAVTQQIVRLFDIKPDFLLYDFTNFFTFIDSNNTRNTIAARGKNKQKRNDLRQFSLALLVTKASRIPLFSDIYQGNKNDTREFKNTIKNLRERLQQLSLSIEDITLVFDKGCNSRCNFKEFKADKGLNYIAGLSVYHNKELREVPFSKFKRITLDNNNGQQQIKVYKCKKEIWGKERTVVMYFSKALFDGQLKGLSKDIKKTKECLRKLQLKTKQGFFIKRGRKIKWTRELLEDAAEQIIKKQFIRDIFVFTVKRKKNSFILEYNLDKNKLRKLKRSVLGKKILLSSHDWSEKEIITGYHGLADVEAAFGNIKNPFHNCVRPQYHWTDQKIKVHSFAAVLALMISALIEKVARDNGFGYSIHEIFEKLLEVRKVKYLTQKKNNKRKEYSVTWALERIEDKDTEKLFNFLINF